MRWRSGIGKRGAKRTFENFEIEPDNEFAFLQAKKWNPDKTTGVLFYGPTGTGKTHLCYAITNSMIDQGIFVRFLRTVEIPRNDQEALEILVDIDETPILILDDLGTEKDTERGIECIYYLIDGRVSSDAPLIVTTNFSPDALKKKYNQARPGEGERLYGRLNEGCLFIPVGGRDHRLDNENI